MDLRKAHKLSPTKCLIIERLFEYRALTAYQVYFLLDPTNIPLTYPHFSWEQADTPKMRSLYNQLSQLQKLGMVYVVAKHDNGQRVFSLTEDGLSVAYSLLDIPQVEGYQRTGWDNEHGYFPYELYRPPKDRLLKHHTLGVDFNVLMELLAIKHNFSYDFIDNRYASVEFTSTDINSKREVEKIFRPDGEFIVRSNINGRRFHSWIEFDMGTEKGNMLHDKFLKYNQFLTYISSGLDHSSLANSIPDTIFFVTTARQNIWSRWQNIFRNYMNTIGRWGTYLNLYVGNLESLENLVISHINVNEIYRRQLNSNLRPLLDDPRFVGQPKPSKNLVNTSQVSSFCFLYENEMKALGWNPFFTVTQIDSHSHQIYLYVKFEEYETSGISKAIDFAHKFRDIDSMRRINARELIPVLIYSENKPHSLNFLGCDQKEAFEQVFVNFLWHDVLGNTWMDKDGNELDSNKVNPLTYFLRYRG
ncbi:hypothetical protein EHV15_35605 [Paenibacillus oralis]|uniref:Replication-relaxation n=1 Tax=Paenibacillus oralis TaxID=2490856 RepID=A0A3P3TAB8_9BACL|nr:replication-relaxation family protein [Paenibacillus oralis]RRJ54900.1 hypothetical protein EHV15_35605 [Paenibacillus oralis]